MIKNDQERSKQPEVVSPKASLEYLPFNDPHDPAIQEEAGTIVVVTNRWAEHCEKASFTNPQELRSITEEFENIYGRNLLLDYNDMVLVKTGRQKIPGLEYARETWAHHRDIFIQKLLHIPTENRALLLQAPELEPYHTWLSDIFEGFNITMDIETGQRILTTHNSLIKEVGLALDPFYAKHKDLEALPDEIIDVEFLPHFKQILEIPVENRLAMDGLTAEDLQTLSAAVKKNAPTAHAYYQELAKARGLKTIPFADRRTLPTTELAGPTFEDAITKQREALQALDPTDHYALLLDFLNNHSLIDIEAGRRYALATANPLLPPHIFMSYHPQNGENTLAHEAGHALGILERIIARLHPDQKGSLRPGAILSFGIPSAFNEFSPAFFSQWLYLQQGQNTSMSWPFRNALATDVHYSAALSEWEVEAHSLAASGKPISSEILSDLFVKTLHQHLGDAVDLTHARHAWMNIPHFRNGAMLTMFAYSFGSLLASAMHSRLQKGELSLADISTIWANPHGEKPKELLQRFGIELNEELWEESLAFQKEHLK